MRRHLRGVLSLPGAYVIGRLVLGYMGKIIRLSLHAAPMTPPCVLEIAAMFFRSVATPHGNRHVPIS